MLIFLKLSPIGTIVFQSIKAIDRDLPNKPNSQISFSIEEGPCSEYFEFPLTTKSDLAIAKLIQYDMFSKCNLTIKAVVSILGTLFRFNFSIKLLISKKLNTI